MDTIIKSCHDLEIIVTMSGLSVVLLQVAVYLAIGELTKTVKRLR